MASGTQIPLLGTGLASGLWLAFIGWFLDNAASQSARQVWIREALKGYTAADFSSGCRTIDGNTPVDWVVRDHVLPRAENCFVVTDGIQPQGIATLAQLKQVPRQKWGWTPVNQIMTPLSQLKPVRPAEAAYSVLQRMISEGQTLLPVVDGSRLIGLVRQDSLLRFAQTRASLKA